MFLIEKIITKIVSKWLYTNIITLIKDSKNNVDENGRVDH